MYFPVQPHRTLARCITGSRACLTIHPSPAHGNSDVFVPPERPACFRLFAAARHGFTRRFKSGPAQDYYKCPPFRRAFIIMGRITGFEPATPGTTNQCSNQLSYIRHTGGADRTRTDDPLHAMQVLYQLSYNPMRRLILYFFLPNVKSIC